MKGNINHGTNVQLMASCLFIASDKIEFINYTHYYNDSKI